MLFTLFLGLIACKDSKETTSNQGLETNDVLAEPETNLGGSILTGEMAGKEMSIAKGSEVEYFMSIVESFNNMDTDGIWKYSNDTIAMVTADGSKMNITQSDFEGLFSTIDSLTWQVDAVLPYLVEDTNEVRVLADTREYMKMKDGSIRHVDLMEEFTFKDGKLANVRQWERAIKNN
jgi:hypothetical protein